VNFGKIARVLPEFKPAWDVRRGVQELYSLYQAIHLQRAEFEGPRFHRIDHLKVLLTSGQLSPDLRWQHPVAAL
jgi:hypothetical protein